MGIFEQKFVSHFCNWRGPVKKFEPLIQDHVKGLAMHCWTMEEEEEEKYPEPFLGGMHR